MIERDQGQELAFPKPGDSVIMNSFQKEFKQFPALGVYRYFQRFPRRVECNSHILLGVYRYFIGLYDLYILGLVNKSMSFTYRRRSFLKYLIFRNYKRLVKRVGLDPDILGALLECTSSLLAGSFVLQCVTGECFNRYRSPDIDIFVPAVNIEIVVQYFNTVLYDAVHFDNFSDEFPRVHSRLRLTHRDTGHRVDLFILAKQCQRSRLCVDSFDFTFLMNYFNGMDFQIWFPTHIIKRVGFYNQVI